MYSTNIPTEVYTVSSLNRELRYLLEGSFPLLWIEGEISNLRQPGSGHIYFSLKDAHAQVRCAMFRMRSNALKFQPKDGMHVLMQARVGLYEERGDYQLIVETIEETGDGALRLAFEALKKRLAAEGLFDAAYKKSLPAWPKTIGILTSATGAAVRDILSVLKRRCANLPVIIYPTQVQGSEAAGQIVRAIQLANHHRYCDVLILARGGGSLEDLWPFNEEIVARAIYASTIPIVSGIGHEIDFTIADFVADHRAPTPSAAAELISPDNAEHYRTLVHLQTRIAHFMQVQLRHASVMLENISKHLQHPGRRLQDQAQRLDNIELRLRLAQTHLIRHQAAALQHLHTKLQRFTPQHIVESLAAQHSALQQRLDTAMSFYFHRVNQRLINTAHALNVVSPLNTLERGFAIVTKNDAILRDVKTVKTGDKIQARLANGILQCLVEESSTI